MLFITVGYTQVKISGNINSKEDNKPIEGATLYNENIGVLGHSDKKGMFNIFVSQIPIEIQVRHIGKATQIIRVLSLDEKELYRDVFLEDEKQMLENIVINTGYGNQNKEKATGAYSVIEQNVLNRGVSSNILDRLEGLSTSLHFDKRVESKTSLSVRGLSTIYANRDPLIVLDNFPYEGSIDNINPSEIESVTVLKDAVASSIWGVRAGNGVIVITTKKGKFKQPLTTSFTSSLTSLGKPDMRNYKLIPSADFIQLEIDLFEKGYYNSLENSPTSPVLSPVIELLIKRRDGLIADEEANALLFKLGNYNIKDELYKRWFENGLNQQYALNVQGGSTRSKYSLMFGHNRDKGNSHNLNTRHNVTLDLSHQLLTNLNVSGTLRYSKSSSHMGKPAIESLAATGAKELLPYTKLTDENGKAVSVPRDFRPSFIALAEEKGLLNWSFIPLEDYKYNRHHNKDDHLLLNIKLKYNVFERLSLEMMMQREQNTNLRNTFYGSESYFTRDLINRFTQVEDESIFRPVPLGSIVDNGTNSLSADNYRGQLNYDYKEGRHDLALFFGGEIRQIRTKGNIFRRYGYNENNLTSSDVDFLSLHPYYYFPVLKGRISSGTGFSETVNRNISLYAMANYTFKERYHGNVSIRRDAANIFGVKQNQKWVPLWSLGIGWTLSNEDFYMNENLPYLKMRASYGYNGNVDNGTSAFTTLAYSGSVKNLVNQTFAFIGSPPNPSLRWERNRVWNVGMDFQGINRTITGSLDLFQKNGIDLIGDAPIDPTTGVANGNDQYIFRGNVASMKGKGFDLELHTNNRIGGVEWQIDMYASYFNNEITKYEHSSTLGRSFINNGLGIVPIVGKPVYSVYAYKWAGLDSETGDPIGIMNMEKTKDYGALLNTTLIDDLLYMGPAIPTHTGSLVNSLKYKDFSFSFMLTYRLGHYYRESALQYNRLYSDWFGHSDYSIRWMKPGDERITSVPSAIYPANVNRDTFYAGSEVLVSKGDNIRLQDVKLSYSLNSIVSRRGINNAELYLLGRNLGMLWSANKRKSDPDVLSKLTRSKEFSIGINLSF